MLNSSVSLQTAEQFEHAMPSPDQSNFCQTSVLQFRPAVRFRDVLTNFANDVPVRFDLDDFRPEHLVFGVDLERLLVFSERLFHTFRPDTPDFIVENPLANEQAVQMVMKPVDSEREFLRFGATSYQRHAQASFPEQAPGIVNDRACYEQSLVGIWDSERREQVAFTFAKFAVFDCLGEYLTATF